MMLTLRNPLKAIESFIGYLRDAKVVNNSEIFTNKITFDEVLSEVLVETNLLAQFTNIRRSYNIVNTDRFYTDYTLLKVVLRRILTLSFNQASFAKENPEVHIQINCQGIRCCILVSNNGHSITEDLITTSIGKNKENKEWGLVNKALIRLRGKISAISNPENGTSYTIMLPDLYATPVLCLNNNINK